MLNPTKNTFLGLLLILLSVITSLPFVSASVQSNISYQNAASFTHLIWNNPNRQPININVLPLQNFSGVPIEKRKENTQYFSHGKIPIEINQLSLSLLLSSYQFKLNSKAQGDYQFQFILEQYHLPYRYSPNDNIWQEYKDEVDRWVETEKVTRVKLTLKITPLNQPILPWSKSVLTQLTQCDINISPQPLLPFASDNKNLLQYVKSIPAQAFIAANNYLILEAIKYLEIKSKFATIEKINGGEILITSINSNFITGEKLSVHQENHGIISSFPIGQVEVAKIYENQATVFPLNFKPPQIRVGDRVSLNNREHLKKPNYLLNLKNSCGMVKVVDAVAR